MLKSRIFIGLIFRRLSHCILDRSVLQSDSIWHAAFCHTPSIFNLERPQVRNILHQFEFERYRRDWLVTQFDVLSAFKMRMS